MGERISIITGKVDEEVSSSTNLVTLEVALKYFSDKIGIPIWEETMKAILEASDKDQIVKELIRYYTTAILTENYRTETGLEAIRFRNESGEYQASIPGDRYVIDSIVNNVYNNFSRALEQLYQDVENLLSDYIDPRNDETVYEIREEEFRKIAADYIGYMNPNNSNHGITYLSSDSDKTDKLYRRIVGIVNKANGKGLDESSDPESIQEIHIDWVEQLYSILATPEHLRGDDLVEWFIATKIFDDHEMFTPA